MTSSVFVLLLAIAASSVYAFSLEERAITIDGDDMNLGDVKLLMQMLVGGENCDERKEKLKCGCEATSCACCRKGNLLVKVKHEVCASFTYIADGDDYEVAISDDGVKLFAGKIDKKGVQDVSQEITLKSKHATAKLNIIFDCQTEDAKKVVGCTKISGMYDQDNDKVKDKVEIDLGCFKLKKPKTLYFD